MSLVELSLRGGGLILLAALLRLSLGRRLPARTFGILWAAAAIRLLLPFRLPKLLSLPAARSGTAARGGSSVARTVERVEAILRFRPVGASAGAAILPRSAFPWLTVIWLTGLFLLLAFLVWRYLRARLALREALPVPDGPALSLLRELGGKRVRLLSYDRITSPFTDGLLRPRICLPPSLVDADRETLRLVLTHELIHIRHLDQLWKLLALLALCIHWFNPAVWLLPFLLSRDQERDCDETLLRRLGPSVRKSYAHSVIALAEAGRAPFPLRARFSRNPIQERIVNIMKWKKPTKWTVAVSCLLLALVAVVFFTGSKSAEPAAPVPETAAVPAEESGKTPATELPEGVSYTLPPEILEDMLTPKMEIMEVIGQDGNTYQIKLPNTGWCLKYGYPVNEAGETYGPLACASVEEAIRVWGEAEDPGEPDLQAYENSRKGYVGYIRNSEVPRPQTLEEAISWNTREFYMNVYLEDGVTVIDRIKIG